MLGHRGCRLGVTYPEIYDMQVQAIAEAACEVAKNGVKVLPEIMIPLIGVDVELDGKRIVFSGDTGWFDELPGFVRGADLFICECNFYDRDYEYHLNYQTLLARRDRFDVKRMILTHFSEEMAPLRGRCEFETADDGMKIKL